MIRHYKIIEMRVCVKGPEEFGFKYKIYRVYEDGPTMLWTKRVTRKSAIAFAKLEAKKFGCKVSIGLGV